MSDSLPDPTPDARTGDATLPRYEPDQLETVLRAATERLKQAGIAAARGDARHLVAHALDLDRAALFLQPDRRLSTAEQADIEALIRRREAREPVARILGAREFWGLDFHLSPATLEPRPDSEVLIEAVLHRLSERDLIQAPLRLLDLGTGTGCLLLALLSELPAAQGLGIDLSAEATETARANAERLGLAARARFIAGDWNRDLPADAPPCDVILANPPYIASTILEQLAPEVLIHDPALALDGGADGLDCYREIAPLLARQLAADGLAALEIGYDQGERVPALLQAAGLDRTSVLADLAGHPRCVLATRS